MRLWNCIAMAGLIGGMLALPVRAQDCDQATGDSYLYADGQGDVYGYSTTYNICQDPSMSVFVYGNLEEAGGYVLDAESDEEDTGNDATAYTAATVFYGDNYQQLGTHYYDYCDYGWLPASPSSTYYTVWSDPPNPVPTVTRTWPNDSGGDPTWIPGGGSDNGAYEVAFSGWDLTGEIPTVTDTGCSSAYSVSAWQTADSAVWANVTVLAYPAIACYLTFTLPGWPVGVLLSPPPPTISVSGNGEIWWLNGAQQQGWATSTVVASSAGASTAWTTTSAAISLPNPATGASITVTPTGNAFSGRSGSDVPLTASAPGYTSKTVNLTVLEPSSLGKTKDPLLVCTAGVGYTVYFYWTINDNNGSPLPGGSSLDVNEAWTSGRQDDWAGNNWDAPPQVLPGTQATAAGQQAATFGDAVQGTGNAQNGAVPPTSCQASATTPVVHWGQAWYVGSATTGSGVLVQNDTIQKMVGTASEQ